LRMSCTRFDDDPVAADEEPADEDIIITGDVC
jgi:hypothetical protein